MVAGSLRRQALAELLGTALLVMAIIGSGIAASRLSPGNVGLELLENAVATGAARYKRAHRQAPPAISAAPAAREAMRPFTPPPPYRP